MSDSKKELETQWLRSVVIPEIVENGKLITNYDKKLADTFKVNDIQINYIGYEEAFMLTNCYRASISLEYAGVSTSHFLVVKKTPVVPQELFDSINFGKLFSNEIETYVTILPNIEKFTQTKLNVPTYYYSNLQTNSATIILEDFGLNGWRMTRDRVNLSLDHVMLAVKYLGNFHAIGFALKYVNSDLYEALASKLKEARYFASHTHPEWQITLIASAKRFLKATRRYAPEVPEEFMEHFKKLVDGFFKYCKSHVKPIEPMVTLCHGDYLRNNIAFKYDEKDEVPIDVMMFDLQTMRLASPMIDLSVFMMLSTFAEVRHKHFQNIFNTYYTAFTQAYEKYAEAELPNYLSRDSLLREYIKWLPYGMGCASHFLMKLVDPINMTSPEEYLNNNEESEEELMEDVMKRGGETVDRELAQQARELFQFSTQYEVDVWHGLQS